MADHDQRFKVLLREFFAEFFALFFPDWAGRFDFAQTVWLDQEVYADPPRGERSLVDLVAQLPVFPSPAGPRPHEPREQVVLVHVEVESSDTVEPLRQRMYDYYHELTRRHGRDILPVAVYLQVGLEGRGIDAYERRLWERRPLRFEYDYVGLPGLAGADFLTRDNWLGVAWSALMRWPRDQRVPAAVQAIERLVASPETPWHKLLLCECVQAYAPLDDSQRIELTELLNQPERGVQTVIKTWTEVAWEQGLEQGRLEGQRRTLRRQLEARFGAPLPPGVVERLTALPAEQLDQLSVALIGASSLGELGLGE